MMQPMRVKILTSLIIFLISLHSSCTPPAHMIRKGWMIHDDKSGSKRKKIVHTAKKYLGTRYKYGGADPFGFDCSGFAMFVYKKNGISIPREARSQYYSAKRVTIRGAKPGDLVFFKIYSNRISHVGIYLGDRKFIHSPKEGKKVSYADIEDSYWKKRYVGVATFFR